MSRLFARTLLVWLALAPACARSHTPVDAATAAPDAPLRDAALVDAGDYIPGDPDARADLEAWQQYCIRISPIVGGGPRSYYEVSCVRDTTYDLTCRPTIREMNHCLDVARSLYDGTNLDITTVPACHDMCPHPDGG